MALDTLVVHQTVDEVLKDFWNEELDDHDFKGNSNSTHINLGSKSSKSGNRDLCYYELWRMLRSPLRRHVQVVSTKPFCGLCLDKLSELYTVTGSYSIPTRVEKEEFYPTFVVTATKTEPSRYC